MAEILIGNIRGGKGDPGAGLKILDYYATFEALSSAVTNPSAGDAYGVGDDYPYDIYVYSETHGWVNNGALQPDINEQTPNYAEATALEPLASGEKISLAFGKIKKAISDFILHLADTKKHVTSSERTSWNGKAPGGHGLGVIADGGPDDTFDKAFGKGSGFYQISSSEDAPDNSIYWLSLLQVSRSIESENETGLQLACLDYYDQKTGFPRAWIRTALAGVKGNWFELMHSGNIDKYFKFVSGSYVGNGAFGSSNKNTIPLDIIPQVMIISRGSGTPYSLTETSIIPFAYDSANKRYVANTNRVLAGGEHSYSPALTMFYKNGAIEWYTESADSKRYKADLQTGYVTFDTIAYSGDEADKMKSINQLNWLDRVYHYFIIGKKA